MKAINSILNFLIKNQSENKNESPEGYCPNCWGRQEFGGQFYESIKNNNIDINSDNPNLGWIQNYVNKHLSSIQLQKEDENLVCHNCKISYKQS